MKKETIIQLIAWLVLIIIITVLVVNRDYFFQGTLSDNHEDDSEKETNSNNPMDIICSVDSYNCGDFETQEQAQEVFDYCNELYGDVHNMDNDGDGIVCESLS